MDNTYNSSFDSFVAALSYLNNAYPDSRRVVVTPGIIELGARARQDHALIGKKLKGIDKVFLTTPDYFSEMNVYNNVVILENRQKLIEELKKLKTPETVILLQGRGPVYAKSF